jgi:hypothetical protein
VREVAFFSYDVLRIRSVHSSSSGKDASLVLNPSIPKASGRFRLRCLESVEKHRKASGSMRTHNRELFRLLRSLYLHLLGISIQCQAALQLSIVISTVLASIGGTLCDIRQHCSPVSSYLEYLYISPFRSRRIRIRPTPARVRKTGLQSCSGAHPLKASHALETVLCSALMQKVPNVEFWHPAFH